MSVKNSLFLTFTALFVIIYNISCDICSPFLFRAGAVVKTADFFDSLTASITSVTALIHPKLDGFVPEIQVFNFNIVRGCETSLTASVTSVTALIHPKVDEFVPETQDVNF